VRRTSVFATVPIAFLVASGCHSYPGLLRPQTLAQLNPRVVALVNELPAVDRQNEDIVGRLFPHGGLVHAALGGDGVMRAAVNVYPNTFLWEPAVIRMPRGGALEIEFANHDHSLHMAFVPSEGDRQLLELPPRSRGFARITLAQPGLYWFGCPVSNHAGRGMLGLILVPGEVPATAKLDRPEQPRP
jgi:PQQ system protein